MKLIQQTEKLRTTIIIVQTNYIALFEKMVSKINAVLDGLE
jgi:hypothetical protein